MRLKQRTPLIGGNRKSFVFEVCVLGCLGLKRKKLKSSNDRRRCGKRSKFFASRFLQKKMVNYRVMKSKLKIKMHRILSTAADYIEITISVLIILLVIVFVLRLASEMYTTVVDMFVHKTANISFDEIISLIFELIIGIELVKMLSNHNTKTTLKLLLFVLARQLLLNHLSASTSLLTIVSVAIIFVIKRFLIKPSAKSKSAKSAKKRVAASADSSACED